MPLPFRADLGPFLVEFAEHHRGIRLGRMFGLPAGYVGRRMFACLIDDGLIVRLPPDVAAREIAKGARPFRRRARPGARTRRSAAASPARRSRTVARGPQSGSWVMYRPKTALDARRMVPTLEVAVRYVAERLADI